MPDETDETDETDEQRLLILTYLLPDSVNYHSVRHLMQAINHRCGHRAYRFAYGFRLTDHPDIPPEFASFRFYVLVVDMVQFKALPRGTVDEMLTALQVNGAEYIRIPPALLCDVISIAEQEDMRALPLASLHTVSFEALLDE